MVSNKREVRILPATIGGIRLGRAGDQPIQGKKAGLAVVHLGGITRAAGKRSCAGFIEVSIGALRFR